MTNVLVFGDSITAGCWDFEKWSWVTRLWDFLNKKKPEEYIVYNLGVSGNISTELLERLKQESDARLLEAEEYKEDSIIVIQIGTNDTQYLVDEKRIRTPIKQFRENIEKIIGLALKIGSKIIVLGITPVDGSKTTPIPWNLNIQYMNDHIEDYNNTIKSVCVELKVPFINLFEKWTKKNYKKLLHDGLHPNSLGHQMIFEAVKNHFV